MNWAYLLPTWRYAHTGAVFEAQSDGPKFAKLCTDLAWTGVALVGNFHALPAQPAGEDAVSPPRRSLECRFFPDSVHDPRRVRWELRDGQQAVWACTLAPRDSGDRHALQRKEHIPLATRSRIALVAAAGPWIPVDPRGVNPNAVDSIEQQYPLTMLLGWYSRKSWSFGVWKQSDDYVWLCVQVLWEKGAFVGHARPACKGWGCGVSLYRTLRGIKYMWGKEEVYCSITPDDDRRPRRLSFLAFLANGTKLFPPIELVATLNGSASDLDRAGGGALHVAAQMSTSQPPA